MAGAGKHIAADPFIKLFGPSRVRLLRLFLFNPRHFFTMEQLISRTQLSGEEVRRELKLLAEAGIVRRSGAAQVKFSLDDKFPYLGALQSVLLDAPLRGNDVYERVRRTGAVKLIVLAGVFAGDFDGRLDVLVVGDRMSDRRLKASMKVLDADIGKEIRFASFATPDFLYRLTISDRFIRDVFDYPHRIVFDRLGIGLV